MATNMKIIPSSSQNNNRRIAMIPWRRERVHHGNIACFGYRKRIWTCPSIRVDYRSTEYWVLDYLSWMHDWLSSIPSPGTTNISVRPSGLQHYSHPQLWRCNIKQMSFRPFNAREDNERNLPNEWCIFFSVSANNQHLFAVSKKCIANKDNALNLSNSQNSLH